MVFKASVPQPTDFLSQSQRDFAGNNLTLSNVWGKPPQENENVGDHVPLTESDIDLHGKHKKVTLVEQSPAPAAPAANEINLFTEDTSSRTEILYQRNGDAAAFPLTSNKGLIQGGIVLRAYVAFDFQGNIIEIDDVDEDGEIVKRKLAFNVSSITTTAIPNSLSEWQINFPTAIPIADYLWVCEMMAQHPPISSQPNVVFAQPKNNATYSNTVSINSFTMWGSFVSTTVSGNQPVTKRGLRMVFQAYTVV